MNISDNKPVAVLTKISFAQVPNEKNEAFSATFNADALDLAAPAYGPSKNPEKTITTASALDSFKANDQCVQSKIPLKSKLQEIPAYKPKSLFAKGKSLLISAAKGFASAVASVYAATLGFINNSITAGKNFVSKVASAILPTNSESKGIDKDALASDVGAAEAGIAKPLPAYQPKQEANDSQSTLTNSNN